MHEPQRTEIHLLMKKMLCLLHIFSSRLVFLHAKTLIRLYAKPAVIPQKIPITIAYTKYVPSLIQNGEQIIFMAFARITIKDNRNQNSSKSKGKRRDLSFTEVLMKELQLQKVLRQTFLFVKAGRCGRI